VQQNAENQEIGRGVSMKRLSESVVVLIAVVISFTLLVVLANMQIADYDTTPSLALDASPKKNQVTSADPVNDQAPTFENPDDSTYFYAMAKNYQISVNVSDGDGYADLDYVNISLWDDTRTTNYWAVMYDEDTDSFTEYDPAGFIILQEGSCAYWKSGDDLDILFVVLVDWDHPDSRDIDVQQYVLDEFTNLTDTDWYESNWDFETRLDYTVGPAVTSDDAGTVDRGDLDESFHITGTVEYYGSSSSVKPLSNTVDVWVAPSENGTIPGPWSDTTLSAGAFDVTCYADNQVGMDTYTIRIVPEGAGSGGTELYYGASATDTYVADRVQVQSYTALNSSRININWAAHERVVLNYMYDMTPVVDGTVSVNGISASYMAAHSGWVFVDTRTTAQAFTYNSASFSGGTHGIGGTVDQNGQDLIQIWDSLNITLTDPTDQRININENASGIVASAVYDYDGTIFDGTLTLNDTVFQYPTVGKRGYTITSASGDSFGITAIGTNDETYCIWDRLIVNIEADNRIPSDEQGVAFSLEVTFAYSGEPCTTYLLFVERNGSRWMSFIHLNKTQFIDSNSNATHQYTVGGILSESAFGITEFSSNIETVVWSMAQQPPAPDHTPPPEPITTLLMAGGIIGAGVLVFTDPRRRPAKAAPTAMTGLSVPDTVRGAHLGATFCRRMVVGKESELIVVLNKDGMRILLEEKELKFDFDANADLSSGGEFEIKPRCEICSFKPSDRLVKASELGKEIKFIVTPEKAESAELGISVKLLTPPMEHYLGTWRDRIEVQPKQLRLTFGKREFNFSKRVVWALYVPYSLFTAAGFVWKFFGIDFEIEFFWMLYNVNVGLAGAFLGAMAVIIFLASLKPFKEYSPITLE